MFPIEQPIPISCKAFVNPHVSPVAHRNLVAKPFVAQLVVEEPVVLDFAHGDKLEIVSIGIDGLVFHS